jgi:hypothetical protein
MQKRIGKVPTLCIHYLMQQYLLFYFSKI